MKNTTCKFCGKSLKNIQIYQKQKFCSRSCYGKSNTGNNHHLCNRVQLKCEICGNDFEVKNSKKEIARFCSRECRGKWWSTQRQEAKSLNNVKKEKICLNCKQSFLAKWRGNKYCSRKCMGSHRNIIYSWDNNPRWNGIRSLKKCSYCGNEFLSLKETNQFCSYSCKSKAMVGRENYNWRGGISFEPYAVEFNKQLKESIRERDNRHCQLCRRLESEEALSIHHIDYDKSNCLPVNLVSLCRSCNSKVNFNREFWKNFFKNKLGIKEGLIIVTSN